MDRFHLPYLGGTGTFSSAGSATEDHEFQGTGSVNNIKGFVINHIPNNSKNPVSTAAYR
ncbi:MAG: hypothetical protein IPN36_10120 [Bacteroidetes bacterium]|nr:hypothetical protein [Bacteroidota bacterium]